MFDPKCHVIKTRMSDFWVELTDVDVVPFAVIQRGLFTERDRTPTGLHREPCTLHRKQVRKEVAGLDDIDTAPGNVLPTDSLETFLGFRGLRLGKRGRGSRREACDKRAGCSNGHALNQLTPVHLSVLNIPKRFRDKHNSSIISKKHSTES